ncbi:hypothetical protein NDU88_002445 [Pleurodeles waltl]|uniref:Uncharacterized protein n=1 Tax=Pleurodeles waltl TaxID=8319 RepID=A0AAV7VCJ8_PLEWA|nr:hypothetical protein NDU88_002445 [Pleurodeles waltl]
MVRIRTSHPPNHLPGRILRRISVPGQARASAKSRSLPKPLLPRHLRCGSELKFFVPRSAGARWVPQQEKRDQFEQARSGATFNKAGLCAGGLGWPCAPRAAPRGLANSSGAHDGVAASSPYLSDGDGVRVTAPVHQARSPDQLGQAVPEVLEVSADLGDVFIFHWDRSALGRV